MTFILLTFSKMDYILYEPEFNYKTGYIKIYRSILDHELFNENHSYSKLEAWLDILLVVNYEEREVNIKGHIFKVQRGETIRSLGTWATRWRWDKNKVRRFLNTLEINQMIDTHTDTLLERFATHLKVCNYDAYQDKKTASDTLLEREPTPNNKYKRINKEKYTVGLPASTPTESEFEERCLRFVGKFNELRKSKFQPTSKVKIALKARLKKYSAVQIVDALRVAMTDQYHIGNKFFYLTPEYILREDILERYLNGKPVPNPKHFVSDGVSGN